MKLLANENIPLSSIKFLRKNNIDIKAIIEDMPGITDIEVLKLSQKEKRIILTFDKDYGELIFKHKIIPEGLIFFKFIPQNPLEPAHILLKILNSLNISYSGYLTVIEKNKLRQRKLDVKSK